MSQIKDLVEYFDTEHDLLLTPAGKWMMDSNDKKKAIDAKRVDSLSWEKYPDDNMGRLFLTEDILVLDIDGAETHFNDDNTVTIVDLDITIPYGLYTQTTAQNKYHFYYAADTLDIPNRIIAIHNSTIDVFTYGTVFEGHTFSEHHQLNEGDIIDIPPLLLASIEEWVAENSLEVAVGNGELGMTSHIDRYNVVVAFLGDTLTTTKQWNAFFKTVMPAEYHPKRLNGLNISKFKLSYDLFNKLAVKLTTTAELDFNEHVVPTLRKLLTMWDVNPDSKQSKTIMWGNILPSLPQHESVFRYSVEEDDKTFQEHLAQQIGTSSPVFRVIEKSKVFFMEVDRFTQLPVAHGGSYYFDQKAAQALHPERNIVSEDGKIVGWDDGVPLVYTINNPYEPSYLLDKTGRHTINLYAPTDYILQAEPATTIDDSNLVYKAVCSTIGETYLELYLAYSAQILFGRSSPTMVLWMAALKTEMGGSGKSVVTLELFSLMLGAAAAGIDSKTVASGWGDVVTSTKVLSLEDMPNMSSKEWELVYSNIKQQNTNSYRKLNMKGGSVVSQRVSIAITGSTNHRLTLSPSDRRFLCLEPAHFHGLSDPLDDVERLELAQLLRSYDHDERVQEYVNHLFHIYDKGFSDKIQSALFIEAPDTIYRPKWVSGGETNSQNIIHALPHPRDLMDLCKVAPDDLSSHLLHLFVMVLNAYNPDTEKTAVSWKWFEEILPYVQADKYKDAQYSKSSIEKMLHVDFKNVGKYAKTWRENLPSEVDPTWSKWAYEGYTFPLSAEELKNYQTVVNEMMDG